MLVLSRKKGQQIAIGDNIKITILRIAGKRTKIGIQAPRGLAVHRIERLPFLRLPPTDGQYDD